MNALIVLIPVSLLFLSFAAFLFIWAVDHGQFDDFSIAGLQPLLDRIDSAASDERDSPP